MISNLPYQFLFFSLKLGIFLLALFQNLELFVYEFIVIEIFLICILVLLNYFFRAVRSHCFLYHLKLPFVPFYLFLQRSRIISYFLFLWWYSFHVIFHPNFCHVEGFIIYLRVCILLLYFFQLFLYFLQDVVVLLDCFSLLVDWINLCLVHYAVFLADLCIQFGWKLQKVTIFFFCFG